MSNYSKVSKIAAAIAVTVGLVSCGGGGGGSSAGGGGGGGGGVVSGAAAKGIIQNGIVTLKDAAGNTLATSPTVVRTGSDGSYNATLTNAGYAGPVFVEITADGTTMIQNEVTGVFEPASGVSGVLLESVGNVTAGQTVSINTTPFTSIVAQLVKNSQGTGPVSTVLVQQAQLAITTTLGFNPIDTRPVDPRNPASASEGEAVKKQAILLAALAQLGTDSNNTNCASEASNAAKLICAGRQLSTAYAGSSISGENAAVVIDGSKIQGLTTAIAAVSSNPDINRTGSTVDPSTDPSTDEIRMAEANPNMPQTTTVQAPSQGFNQTDVAAVKTLFNNLRSNAAALDNDELNGPVENQLADFADSITNQATGLESGPFEISEATALGIELMATYRGTAAADPSAQRQLGAATPSGGCLVLSGVTVNSDGIVTAVQLANSTGQDNSRFVGCTVFLDFALRPDGNGFYQTRNYFLMTPVQGMANTFDIASDSRFCNVNNSSAGTDTCLDLTEGEVIDVVGGSDSARASGSLTLDNMGVPTSMSGNFSGRVVPPLEFDFSNPEAPTAVALADTTTVTINFTATFGEETSRFAGSGSFRTTSGDEFVTSALDSFVAEGTFDPETGEGDGTLSAEGRIETQLGALRGSFEANSDTGSLEFTGAIDLVQNGTRATLFEGSVNLSSTPAMETSPATISALLDGTFRLPNRPVLELELQVSNAVLDESGEVGAGAVAFTYQQNGTTVIINVSRNAQGAESVTITSPTSMVSVGPFDPDTTGLVDVLRDGRVAARYDVANARINYVDGSFEQF
ncbi:MAG TPA: hypothetical protein VFV43_13400 [Limnobacter sp.]|nr:hypothetical protein [Limnobacter sp.]